MDEYKLLELMKENASKMRRKSIEMAYNLGNTGAHLGGGLSLIEIMSVLYTGVLKYDINDMLSENRDRLIFSKGHGTLALYTALNCVGLVDDSLLKTYKNNESILSAHPSMNEKLGIEFSTGSLGQGLSLGVGCSLGMKLKGNSKSKIYVILGDGECNEGSIWEAAWSASHFGCSNIIVIVDCNGLQYDGETGIILGGDNLDEKWKSFGWDVVCVDGHDVDSLYRAMKMEHTNPLVIIARTVKGKGISFMENNAMWHNHSLNQKQYELAVAELEGELV